jgi:hypothetical protein
MQSDMFPVLPMPRKKKTKKKRSGGRATTLSVRHEKEPAHHFRWRCVCVLKGRGSWHNAQGGGGIRAIFQSTASFCRGQYAILVCDAGLFLAIESPTATHRNFDAWPHSYTRRARCSGLCIAVFGKLGWCVASSSTLVVIARARGPLHHESSKVVEGDGAAAGG